MTKPVNTLPVLLATFRQHEAAYAAALNQSEDHPDLDKIADAENQCLSGAIGIPATTWPDLLAKAELVAEAVHKSHVDDDAMTALLADLRAFTPAEHVACDPGRQPSRAALIKELRGDIATALDQSGCPLAIYSLQRAERTLALLFPLPSDVEQAAE